MKSRFSRTLSLRSFRPVSADRKGLNVLPLISGLILFTPCSSPARSHDANSYGQAVATADRLLEAWRRRDADSAMKELSPGAKKRQVGLSAHLVGLSNPHHASFEIEGPRTDGPNRLTMSFREFEDYTGYPETPSKTPDIALTLERSGSGTWQVADFPEGSVKSRVEVTDAAGYTRALAAVDDLLAAWRASTPASVSNAPGLELVAAHGKLAGFLQPDEKSPHVAYELDRGVLTHTKKFSFRVRLYTGGRTTHVSEAVVVVGKRASGSWVVEQVQEP